MNGLHNLVAAGKVLYLGVSDTPAWVVAKANTYARLTGKAPFVIYQGAWNVLQRDMEREIIPLCRAQGPPPPSPDPRKPDRSPTQGWPSRRGTCSRRARSARTRRRSSAGRAARKVRAPVERGARRC